MVGTFAGDGFNPSGLLCSTQMSYKRIPKMLLLVASIYMCAYGLKAAESKGIFAFRCYNAELERMMWRGVQLRALGCVAGKHLPSPPSQAPPLPSLKPFPRTLSLAHARTQPLPVSRLVALPTELPQCASTQQMKGLGFRV